MLTPFHLLVGFLTLSSTYLCSPRHGMTSPLAFLALQRRQTATCDTDTNCNSASNGLTQCTSDSSTSSDFLSCFCTSYAQSLLTCYENGCFDGTDLQTSAQYVLESCALYGSGDTSTANACLSSADPNSSSCQAALNNESGTSTDGTIVTSSRIPPSTPTFTPTTAPGGLTSPSKTSTLASSSTHAGPSILKSGSAQMADQIQATSFLCLYAAAALALLQV